MNNIIKKELLSRMTLARKAFTKVPKKLAPLLEYYDKQPLDNVVNYMISTLQESFRWNNDTVVIQAAGFEWYYDGDEAPYALGYGYSSFNKLPNLKGFKSDKTDRVRDDFDGGLQFGKNEFVDCGGFNVAEACFPLFTYIDCEGGEHALIDDFINLFTARMFYAMHLAMSAVVQSDAFNKLKIEKPFYFFANNHDWSPCLLFELNDETSEPENFGNDASLVVPELDKFLKKLEKTKIKKLLQEDYVNSLQDGPIENYEKALLELPMLKSEGHSLKLTLKEISEFGGRIIRDKAYQEISFEALAFYCNLLITDPKSGIFNYKDAIIALYLNNSTKAEVFIEELTADNETLKDQLIDDFKNILRWVTDDAPETRYPNSNLHLYESEEAQLTMDKFANCLEELKLKKENTALKRKLDKLFKTINNSDDDLLVYNEFMEKLAKNQGQDPNWAGQISAYTGQRMADCIVKKEYEKATKTFNHFCAKLVTHLNKSGNNYITASMAIVLSVHTKDYAIGEKVLEEVLVKDFDMDNCRYSPLLYNLACYFAAKGDRDNLIMAAKRASMFGKKAKQFIADSDFAPYLNDEEFMSILNHEE